MNSENISKIIKVIVALVLLASIGMGWALPLQQKPVVSVTSQAVREKITFDARDDGYFYNAADLYFYSDDHATQKFKIDGGTGALTLTSMDIGGDLTLQNDETISNSSNGIITMTVASAGYVAVSTGSLKVGNGTPSVSLNGEDLYVEGTLEVDGAGRFDSTLEVNSTLTLQNDETLVNSSDGIITATVAASGYLDVSTGNLKVGNGTPGVTLNGEDAYVEGTLEVDGAGRFDSTLEVNSTLTLQNDETIVNSSNGIITATVEASGYLDVSTGNLKVGNGTPTVTLNGEDAYVEGTLEVDGAARFDGAVSANSTFAFSGNATMSAFSIYASQNITPANATPFTPTHSMVVLTPAGAVTPTIAACTTNGTWLVVYNANNVNVVFADSGNFVLSGALTLGQYDTVQLMCVATKWVQIAAVVAN